MAGKKSIVKGIACPKCGNRKAWLYEGREALKCTRCGNQFTLKSEDTN